MAELAPLAVDARNIVKRFGMKSVLSGIDFQAQPGEFIALLGPNGAGKTTLLRVLASLLRPSQGEIFIFNDRLSHQSQNARQQIGFVSHQPALYGDLTAAENLSFFGKLFGVEALAQRVSESLDLVGLADRRDDLVRTFSRGMQQRIAIARATLHSPNILIFDEPYTGLDIEASLRLDTLLLTLSEQGKTIIISIHDFERAAQLASRFDILDRGKLAASATRTDLESQTLADYYRAVVHRKRGNS